MSKEFNSPKLDKIMQLGILTKDIEKTIKCYEENFGIGPWTEVGTMSGKNFELYVNGERFTGDFFKVSFLHRYGFEIELIQPLTTDPTPYNEIGTGFNHFCCWVDDLDGAIKDFEDAGFEVAMLMESSGGLKVAYIDCLKAFGHYVEIHNPQPFLHDMCNGLRENWDGSDPVRPMRRG